MKKSIFFMSLCLKSLLANSGSNCTSYEFEEVTGNVEEKLIQSIFINLSSVQKSFGILTALNSAFAVDCLAVIVTGIAPATRSNLKILLALEILVIKRLFKLTA